MKKLVMVAAAMLVFSFAASATDYGQWETFWGYTYTRFETGNFIPAPFDTNVSSINANGGSAQVARNFNRWFGVVLDAGAVTTTSGGLGNLSNPILFPSTFSRGNASFTLMNYLLGPRVSFKRGSRYVPYVQTLFGGATAWEGLPVPDIAFVTPINVTGGVILPNGANLRYTRATSGFAMTAGGGLDIKVNRHIYVRPVQAEYFLTRLSPIGAFGTTNRNNFRYSAGINFSFGEPK
jgi:opacity protein-like surface antigen